jgi:hypothetical protein
MIIKSTYFIGETPLVSAAFYDVLTHLPIDPEVVTISVYDPNGLLKIDAVPLTKDSEGKYHYAVDTSGFTVFGEYATFVDAGHGILSSAEKAVFTLKPRP